MGAVAIVSNDDARGVDIGVRLTKRGDDAIAAAFGRSEIDEEHLVLFVMNHLGQFRAQADEVGASELAFEDGILEMIAKSAKNLEDLPEALIVADIVGDQI